MERVRQHIPNAQIFLALITGVSLSTLRQTHQSVPLLEFYILYNTPPAVANYPFVHYTLFPSFNIFPLPPPSPRFGQCLVSNRLAFVRLYFTGIIAGQVVRTIAIIYHRDKLESPRASTQMRRPRAGDGGDNSILRHLSFFGFF